MKRKTNQKPAMAKLNIDFDRCCANCRRARKDPHCIKAELLKNAGKRGVSPKMARSISVCPAWAPKRERGEVLRPSCFECQHFNALRYFCPETGEPVFCPSVHQCEHFKPYSTSPLLRLRKKLPPEIPGLEKQSPGVPEA